MKTTRYFDEIRRRPDGAAIRDEWVARVIAAPEQERKQADGRIRRLARIEEAGGRWLRIVLLPDGETVRNAFFDRGFKP